MDGQDQGRVPTNLRLLLMLEALGAAGRPLTATELGAATGLAKQTAHRLCATLEGEGFILRAGGGGRGFVPARRARTLGRAMLFADHGHATRHQVLLDVARRVEETVNFVVPTDGGMSYLDRVETDWPFRVQLPVGTSVPFHCTASGKTYMASMPPRARDRFVGSLSLDRRTAGTITSPAMLLAELEATARRGYAVDDEEFVDGMVAVAVPVVDEEGRYAASLAFHGPVPRLTVGKAVERLDVLREGADRLRRLVFAED